MKKKNFDNIDNLAQDAFKDFEVPFNSSDWMTFQQQLDKETAIDNIAKEALENYEVPLAPNSWNDFEKAQQRKKGATLYIWWSKAIEVGVMSLLLLGTLFHYPYSKKSTNNNNLAYSSTHTPSSSTITSNDNDNSTTTTTDLEVSTVTPSSSVVNSLQTINTNQPTNNIGKVIIPNKEYTVANTQKVNHTPSTITPSNKKTNNTNINQETVTINTNNNSLINKKKSFNQLTVIESQAVQLAVPTCEKNTIEPITELKATELKAPHTCRNYWGAVLGVGANMPTSMGKTSIGYSGGLTYEKEFSRRIALKVGLLGAYKQYSRTDLMVLDRSQFDGEVYEITQVKTSNLILIEIPLAIHYTCFRNDKWHLYATTGLSVNGIFSRTYSGSQKVEVNNLTMSTELNSNDFERGLIEGGQAKQNIFLSLGGGFGVERKLDDNLSLYLSPTYRHSINTVHNDLLHTFNVNIGIKKAL